MSHQPYDATAKELLETDPAGWAAFLGVERPPDHVRVINSDLTTLTAATDKVLRIEDAPPWLLHIEFQSAWDDSLPRRLLMYNAALGAKHEMPVATVVVLLVRKAQSSELTGSYSVAPPFGPAWEFRYTLTRVWQLPADRLLGGPLAVVPLALIADAPETEVPALLTRASDRIRHEANVETGDRLMTAIGFLLQLRYGAMTAEEMIRKVPNILDLGPFRTFLEEGLAKGRAEGRAEAQAEARAEGRAEGRAECIREMILDLGRKKFGEPTVEQTSVLSATTDFDRLKSLSEKLLDATTWEELLKSH